VAAPAVVVPPFVLALGELAQIAESAGLVWVNSDAEKIQAARQAMAAEPVAIHVPRERQPMVIADEGPLVLVETKKDLSQLKLPFDHSASSASSASSA
jgi:ribonuclease E